MADDQRVAAGTALLLAGAPSPAVVVNPGGSSPMLFVGDHAGRLIPPTLGSLGLECDELDRHIGWDIGVRALGEVLAEAIDAVFIHQLYSRLVVDCNRHPDATAAIPPVSDGTVVPGNEDLSDDHKAERIAAIHEPYHRRIAAELERRRAEGRRTVLVSLHSFTPALRTIGFARPWQIGVLHDSGDVGFARALLDVLRASGDMVVGDNEPYAMIGIDYTVPFHAYPVALPYAELEVRQDLLETEHGVAEWSARLAAAIGTVLS